MQAFRLVVGCGSGGVVVIGVGGVGGVTIRQATGLFQAREPLKDIAQLGRRGLLNVVQVRRERAQT